MLQHHASVDVHQVLRVHRPAEVVQPATGGKMGLRWDVPCPTHQQVGEELP